MTSVLKKLLPLALLFWASTAGAAERPLNCNDDWLSNESLGTISETTRTLVEDPELTRAIEQARAALGVSYTNTLDRESQEKSAGHLAVHDSAELSREMGALLKSKIVHESIARSFRHMGMRKKTDLTRAVRTLRTSKPLELMSFTDLVIQQIDNTVEQALILADKDRLDLVEKRWGISRSELLELVQNWQLLRASVASEIRIALLGWLRVIDVADIVAEVKKQKKERGGKPTSSEQILAVRLLKPHTTKDLAENRGPIDDSSFGRRMALVKTQGFLIKTAKTIRYPNQFVFVMALSILPVTVTHGLLSDWDLTNTLATLIGGVATCPSLIELLARPGRVEDGSGKEKFRWYELLTLKQLNELRDFMKKNPKLTEELRLDEASALIDTRITELRALRYGN